MSVCIVKVFIIKVMCYNGNVLYIDNEELYDKYYSFQYIVSIEYINDDVIINWILKFSGRLWIFGIM